MKSKGEDTPGRGQQPQVAPAAWSLENGKEASVAEHVSEGACGRGSISRFKGIIGDCGPEFWFYSGSSGVCKGCEVYVGALTQSLPHGVSP